MNKRIRELAEEAGYPDHMTYGQDLVLERFAKSIIESVLDEVKERAYYTGDRDWSDEVDRPWIQLEFGYGSLADAQKGIFK
jgi:hypothetical protein